MANYNIRQREGRMLSGPLARRALDPNNPVGPIQNPGLRHPPLGPTLPPNVRPAPPMSGPTPPVQGRPAPPMSKPLPPQVKPAPTTSKPLPPQRVTVNTGGNTPPSVVPTNALPPLAAPKPPTLPAVNGNQFVASGGTGVANSNIANIIKQLQAAFPTGTQIDPNKLVQTAVDSLLNRSNPYIDRARQRGLDFANSRGLLNSSIAAGASEGAAIDAAMPLIQESLGITNRREAERFAGNQAAIAHGMNLTGQREQQGFQGQQNQLDRVQGVNNALLANQLAERQAQLANYYSERQMHLDGQIRQRLQADQASQQDWLNNRNFSREFNGVLSMMPINSAFDMSRMVQQYALENPEVYTPQVISGMTNFFQQNMMSILAQYFPDMVNTGG